MTEKLTIERLKELDGKRTQGEWYGKPKSPYVHCKDVTSKDDRLMMVHDGCAGDGEFYRNHPVQAYRDRLIADAQFIAAAPQIAELCFELSDKLFQSESSLDVRQQEMQLLNEDTARLRKALEAIANHSHPSDRNPFAMQNIANKALTTDDVNGERGRV